MTNTAHESPHSRLSQIPQSLALPLARWSSIDLMATAVIGVVFGVAYWGWSSAYTALSTPLTGFLGSSIGLLGGPWLIAGVVAGLVVRRPGAALFAELLAAAVEAIARSTSGAGSP